MGNPMDPQAVEYDWTDHDPSSSAIIRLFRTRRLMMEVALACFVVESAKISQFVETWCQGTRYLASTEGGYFLRELA
jgi:hypothetical protein